VYFIVKIILTDNMNIKTQTFTMKRKHIKEKTEMKSLVTILNELQKSGYRTQFKATVIGLLSLSSMNMFKANEIKVVHYYRFEGESNPSDSSIVYAIVTNDGEKGTLVDGYGTSSDTLVSDYMAKVEEIHK
jgi:hypothetical protein